MSRELVLAQEICDEVNARLRKGPPDPAEALMVAMSLLMGNYNDEYKARVYAEIIEGWHDAKLELFIVARALELAD